MKRFVIIACPAHHKPVFIDSELKYNLFLNIVLLTEPISEI